MSGHARIPDWILDHGGISDGALKLWAVLERYANREGEAWPGHHVLARKTQKSVRAVERLIGELKRHGAISVKARPTPTSKISSVVYLLHPDGPAKNDGSERVHGPAKNDGSAATDPPNLSHGPAKFVGRLKELIKEPINTVARVSEIQPAPEPAAPSEKAATHPPHVEEAFDAAAAPLPSPEPLHPNATPLADAAIAEIRKAIPTLTIPGRQRRRIEERLRDLGLTPAQLDEATAYVARWCAYRRRVASAKEKAESFQKSCAGDFAIYLTNPDAYDAATAQWSDPAARPVATVFKGHRL